MRNLLFVCLMLAGFIVSAQNVECQFKQSTFIKASGKTLESEGTLKLVGKDKMEMNYTKPAGDYFIIDGKSIKMNLRGKKSVMDTEKNTAMRNYRNTLLNCIHGNWKQAATDNNADITITEKGNNKVVTITAKKQAPRGYSKIIVTARKSDNLPVEMVLEEFNGTVTTYKLSNIVKK